jgi:hypothetical protein
MTKQNKMITSLLQVHEVADKMFSSDSAIISVNIQTSWGLVTAFRDGTVRLAA